MVVTVCVRGTAGETARGTQLHIIGGEQAAEACVLRRLHHDRLLCLTDSVDAVIALLPRP